ncbi:hypothetical protein OEZ85_002080 [Tetradesmus obliquus]|uniref:Uncharacterized protein n=1 Tax=Tetradesmus obliquus TaxID=3088 RepID=A0ABY8U1V0_TETOB|nr:hypothetical protein OEZ85_002080 [Tetradesmus obliquus]
MTRKGGQLLSRVSYHCSGLFDHDAALVQAGNEFLAALQAAAVRMITAAAAGAVLPVPPRTVRRQIHGWGSAPEPPIVDVLGTGKRAIRAANAVAALVNYVKAVAAHEGEIQRTDYRVHSANETCTFKDTGACSCAGARQLLLWPKEVVLSQPKKLTLKDALLVLQHFSRKLQLLSSQAAAADPGDQLGAYVKLQPCAAFITAALSNLAEAAAGQKRKAGAAAEAVSTPR